MWGQRLPGRRQVIHRPSRAFDNDDPSFDAIHSRDRGRHEYCYEQQSGTFQLLARCRFHALALKELAIESHRSIGSLL